MGIKEKVEEFILNLNEKGIPLPLIRDPDKDGPSVSLTLLVISTAILLIGLIGKLSGLLGGVDITQALYWHGMTSSLYFFRKMPAFNAKLANGNELTLTETKEEKETNK